VSTNDSPDVIQMTITGQGALEITTGESGLHHCPSSNSGRDGVTVCRQSLRLMPGQTAQVAVYAGKSEVTVEDIRIDVATTEGQAALSGQKLILVFLALLALGPIFVQLRSWPSLQKLALIGIGLSWIAYASPLGLVVDIAFALLGYAIAQWLARQRQYNPPAIMTAVIVIGVGLLLIKNLAPVATTAFANPGGLPWGIPLGISYFAIRMIDLAFTASSGGIRKLKLLDYFSFLFFPFTLPAGPILTYNEFLNCAAQRYSITDFAAGAARVLIGIVKKSVADAFILPLMMRLMNSYLSGGRADTPIFLAAMLFANTIYVYLDFSAYSDLAIGSARAAGYSVPENFNWPLLKTSLRKFWQAWHMTLTRWVMRRIYFPAFISSRSVTLSMFGAMLVIGIWHSVGLPWVLWAAHHSMAMAAESRLLPAGAPAPASRFAAPVEKVRRVTLRVLGVVFVWSWVSLGHSFTLFSSPAIALRCYLTAVSLPLDLLARLAKSIGI
jgi:alginate O-acetyltransferase complex protein AlgI